MSEDNLEVVSQEMMDELEEVKKRTFPAILDDVLTNEVGAFDTTEISKWFEESANKNKDMYLGLQKKILLHCYFNEPQFEAEKPKKWIVRAKDEDNDYWYLLEGVKGIRELDYVTLSDPNIVKFDTKEEAEKWATPQCEVVEVEE